MRRSILASTALLLATALSALAPEAHAAAPPDVHPRLWIRAKDLDELKKRANPQNPVYEEGFKKVVAESVQKMDVSAPGDIVSKDDGSWAESYTECSELYAQVFGLMYLVSPDGSAEKQDYGKRAKTLLMNVINKVYTGMSKFPEGTTLNDIAPGGAKYYGDAWSGGQFPLNLRAFIQDAIPLTVDWIYPLLSAEEKAKIRTVFLYWSRIVTERAATTGQDDRPKPLNVYNDPQLLHLDQETRSAARFGMNNWFAMHMRLLGLMSLAIDAADDAPQKGGTQGSSFFREFQEAPAGSLRNYLKSATGAYLYMADYGHRNDGRGGLSPEGMQYFTAGLGPTAQFYLALKTSGWDDPTLYPVQQDQVVMMKNPFWSDLFPAFLLQLSPVPAVTKSYEWHGPLYQAAWYGDGEKYLVGEMIGLFGTLARFHDISGNADLAQTSRWIAANVSPGSEKQMIRRVQTAIANGSTRLAILYFLAMDPNAKPAVDPRPKLPQTWFSPGIQSLSVRTGWDKESRWLSYILPWNRIDHQHGEGNMFQWFRKGEWLTKKWVAYGHQAARSELSNTTTVLNDPPKYNSPGNYQHEQWKVGSQWQYISAGDPLLVGWSDTQDYTYAYGDATPLYNSKMDGAMATAHVSRSLVWLKPDHLVIYDRVASKKTDRFKRFWLNFENEPKIDGTLVTGTTKGGQQLFVKSLLPAKSTLAIKNDHPVWDAGGGKQTASGEHMAHRLMVEAPNDQDVRFLHVLQGADAGGSAEPSQLIRSTSGTAYEGAAVHETAVVFPRDFGEPPTALAYDAPSSVKTHVITGLSPQKGYTITLKAAGDKVSVSVAEGGSEKSDKGGVLAVDSNGKGKPLGPTAQGGAASLEAIKAVAAGLPAPGSYSNPTASGSNDAPLPTSAPGSTGNGVPTTPAPTPGASSPRGCGCGAANAGSGTLTMTGTLGVFAAVVGRSRRRKKSDKRQN
ncbi:MAG: hypothetical protein IPK82_05210 [Polyangiaceae bacterium]|nr:hypothetical protein [Polyangiaceae bacterium]